uniref:MARVEL domain-containing protein n=1 Tax=Lepeophtheirus salmonis TaxID=72036 RepID=A0A0K2V9W8_LEPSM
MGISFNTMVLRTPSGFLKLLEIILVFIILILVRFVFEHEYIFGSTDMKFIGIGTIVGYSIIVPCVLLTYMLGSNMSILELFINLIGSILFIVIGAIVIQTYSGCRRRGQCNDGLALGSLCIVSGVLFLIDFLFAIRSTRITIIHTRHI